MMWAAAPGHCDAPPGRQCRSKSGPGRRLQVKELSPSHCRRNLNDSDHDSELSHYDKHSDLQHGLGASDGNRVQPRLRTAAADWHGPSDVRPGLTHNPSTRTFPIQNVELRVKRKAMLSNKVFVGSTSLVPSRGPRSAGLGKYLYFSVPFSTV